MCRLHAQNDVRLPRAWPEILLGLLLTRPQMGRMRTIRWTPLWLRSMLWIRVVSQRCKRNLLPNPRDASMKRTSTTQQQSFCRLACGRRSTLPSCLHAQVTV